MKNNLITLVKEISYRKNVLLIEFNKSMNININANDIKHSYLNFENYAIEVKRVFKPFPKETKVKEIEFAFSVQFNFPNFFLENIHQDAILHLGYVDKKKIFYIKSADDDILDLCNSFFLGKEVDELDLENGKIEILDNRRLKYKYNGKNGFGKISIEDFYILTGQEVCYPSLIKKINSKEFILTFTNSILNEIQEPIFLKLIEEPLSIDVYGFNIKGNIEIPLLTITPSTLNSFNFLNYKNKVAYFKLQFSKPIKIFDSTDFIVRYNNSINKTIKYLNINNERKTIDIAIKNINIDNLDNAIFEIFTSVKTNDINTIDDNENIICIEKKNSSKLFKSLNINWILKDYNFSKSVINIEFNNELFPNSLINDYSIFEGNISSWNGERLTIKPHNLIIYYENHNTLILNLNKNHSFGKIKISPKINFKILDSNKISNKKPCYIYIQNNVLFLEFSEQENMDAILVFMKCFEYFPYNDIKSREGNFIFYGYTSTGKYKLKDTMYIEPLVNGKDNPFKGGSFFGNYILAIHNNNKIRSYGDNFIMSKIKGFIRIVGRLENDEIAKLQNLNVEGDIIIDSSKINIIFDNVECFKEVKIKTH